MEMLTQTTLLYAIIFGIIAIATVMYLRLSSKLSTKEQENQEIQEKLKSIQDFQEMSQNILTEYFKFQRDIEDKLSFLNETYSNHYTKKLESEKRLWIAEQEKAIRKDSIERSRRVIRGQATEHLAPLTMPGLNIKDFRFVGNPIDYIVFSGASDITDKTADTEFEKIILLEIKSGKSRLNKVQRRIRDAVKNGNIEFVIYNPDTQETKTITME